MIFGLHATIFPATSDLVEENWLLAEGSRVPERVFAAGLESLRKRKCSQKRGGGGLWTPGMDEAKIMEFLFLFFFFFQVDSPLVKRTVYFFVLDILEEGNRNPQQVPISGGGGLAHLWQFATERTVKRLVFSPRTRNMQITAPPSPAVFDSTIVSGTTFEGSCG